MPKIRIDYGNVRANVRRLQSASNICEDVAGDVGINIRELPNVWEGAASNVFITEMNLWTMETKKISEELIQLSSTINRIVNEFEEVEKKISGEILGGVFLPGGGSGGGGMGGGRF